jgi:hypothetical protein
MQDDTIVHNVCHGIQIPLHEMVSNNGPLHLQNTKNMFDILANNLLHHGKVLALSYCGSWVICMKQTHLG